jgi:hypothetical protein
MSQDIVANIAASTLTVRPENLGSVPSREAFLSFPKLPVRLLDAPSILFYGHRGHFLDVKLPVSEMITDRLVRRLRTSEAVPPNHDFIFLVYMFKIQVMQLSVRD